MPSVQRFEKWQEITSVEQPSTLGMTRKRLRRRIEVATKDLAEKTHEFGVGGFVKQCHEHTNVIAPAEQSAYVGRLACLRDPGDRLLYQSDRTVLQAGRPEGGGCVN